jgi:L-Ala-D/L-Glu epimerase
MIAVTTQIERWELVEPFTTARDSTTHVPVLLVTLAGCGGARGWAEAAGVDYDGETPEVLATQIASVQNALHDGITGHELLHLLPAGGARNALDCALWDLRAKETGIAAWRTAGLALPRPVTTAFTIGLGSEADIRRKAREAMSYDLLKLKLDAERHVDLVRIVREVPG